MSYQSFFRKGSTLQRHPRKISLAIRRRRMGATLVPSRAYAGGRVDPAVWGTAATEAPCATEAYALYRRPKRKPSPPPPLFRRCS